MIDRYLQLELRRLLPRLDATLPRSFVEEVAAATAGLAPTGSAADSLRHARSVARFGPPPPPWLGTLRPDLDALRRRGREQASADLPAHANDADAEDDDADQTERSAIAELLSGLSNPLGNVLQQMLGMRRTPGDGSGGQVGGSLVTVRSTGRGAGQRAAPSAPVRRVDRRRGAGTWYDEWDARRCAYRSAWVRIAELGLPAYARDVPVDAGERRLRRQLAPLMRSPDRRASTSTGDDLNLTNLVDMRVEARTGRGGEWQVFSERRLTGAGFGVLLVLDATSSGASDAGGLEVFERQSRLTAALAAAFDDLGVRCAVAAFRSFGRQNVQWLTVKSYDEPWRSDPRRRLAGLSPAGYTRLGAAIRHATQVAPTSGESRNCVLLVTDGVPYDDQYEGVYATADCRRAVEEACEARIAVVGLGVGADESTDAWMPDDFHVIDEVDAPGQVVVAALRRALRRTA